MSKDFYSILDLDKNCTSDDIRKAYRKKALSHHPDKGGDVEEFKRINEAYETLSDETKRAFYDSPPVFIDPISIIRDFHRAFMNVRTPVKPIVHTINTTLEDICMGKKIKLKINRRITCECNSEGINLYCRECKDKNIISPVNLVVTLSPEMIQNNTIVFKNQGNQEQGKGETGDVIVNISCAPHAIYTIDNFDLVTSREISLRDALCGSNIHLVHPDGRKITLYVPCLESPSTIHTISGFGLKIKDNIGSLKIKYKINFPTLSPEKIEQLRQILPE